MRGSNQQGVVLLYYVYAWCGHDGGRTLRVNPLACLRFFIETIMGEIQVKNVSFFEIYTVAENSYLRIPSTQSEKIYKTRNCYSFWKCDFFGLYYILKLDPYQLPILSSLSVVSLLRMILHFHPVI